MKINIYYKSYYYQLKIAIYSLLDSLCCLFSEKTKKSLDRWVSKKVAEEEVKSSISGIDKATNDTIKNPLKEFSIHAE